MSRITSALVATVAVAAAFISVPAAARSVSNQSQLADGTIIVRVADGTIIVRRGDGTIIVR